MPLYHFWGEGSLTKIDYRKKGALILASLPEDPDVFSENHDFWCSSTPQPSLERKR